MVVHLSNVNNTKFSAIQIYPLLGLKAIRTKRGGAWRAWSIIRNLDPRGAGVVQQQEADQLAAQSGIPGRRWKRWVAQAIDEGFIHTYTRHRDGQAINVFGYSGAVSVAQLLECNSVGKRMVDLSIDLLIRHNCLSYVWAAYLSTFDDRPVSRTTLRISSGVPERTQVRYEDGLRILKYQNFAVSKWPAENIAGIQEFFIPHAFVWIDPDSGGKSCRLENSRLQGRQRSWYSTPPRRFQQAC